MTDGKQIQNKRMVILYLLKCEVHLLDGKGREYLYFKILRGTQFPNEVTQFCAWPVTETEENDPKNIKIEERELCWQPHTLGSHP